jgi:diguanylate cyclase (GGDEF)-like protein
VLPTHHFTALTARRRSTAVGGRRAADESTERPITGARMRAKMRRMHRLTLALTWLLLAAVAIMAPAPAPAADAPAAEIVQRAIAAGRNDPEDARRLAEEALGLLAARPDADLEIRALLVLCDYHAERKLDTARELLARATALLSLARRGGLRAGVHSCEGDIFESTGDNANAMAAYGRAVSSAEAAGDDEMLANALYQRGWLRGLQGDYALGLIDLRRAVMLYEKANMAEHARTAVNGIATIYNRMGDYAQAQHYYAQALKVQLAIGNQREAVVSLYNLGRTRENLNDWDGARGDYLSALEVSRRIDYARGVAYALRGLAGVHNARGEWAAALERLAEAKKVAADLPDARLQAQLALVRGVALRGLKRPAEGLASLNAALTAFRTAEALAEQAATHAALADTLADLGDWRAAFEQQRLLKAATDRLHARQLDQRFTTLKVEFDTAAREKENALLVREKVATEEALAQQRRVGALQVVVIALAAVLVAVLGLLAWRQRQTSHRMRALALTDELTALPNRRAVLARLDELLQSKHACAVLIIDLDHFKVINDRHGHLVGDDVLRAVAAVLTEAVRDPMFVGRMGGEEFLLLLPDATVEAARQVAERVREAVVGLDDARWPSDCALTVSIGVTIARPGLDRVSDALRRADQALYAAKAAGRNRVHENALTVAA